MFNLWHEYFKYLKYEIMQNPEVRADEVLDYAAYVKEWFIREQASDTRKTGGEGQSEDL